MEPQSNKLQNYLAKAARANTRAFLLHTKFLEDLVTLNGSAFNDMADSGVNGLQQLTEAKTFMEAFENSLNQGVALRDKVHSLFKDSTRALEDLQYELKDVYIGDGISFEEMRQTATAKKHPETMLASGSLVK